MATADRVQAQIMDKMLRGEFAPGSWLRQDELAARFGVSKIPVREALQRLVAIGLLNLEPNRGVVVPHLTAAEANETFELRRSIEPLLLERSIEQLTIIDLAEAEMALGEVGGSVPASNWVFHRALYRSSGWERGLAIVHILQVAVAPYVALYTEGLGGAQQSDAEHRALLELCRSKDLPGAMMVLMDHLQHAQTVLADFLDGGLGDG
ncbi:MAG: GntR family transcriptional regulator [Acidimicrobiales bacterium]|nr:GntR family transcriptional regulator [Acidimicrobiales bacterium]